MSGPVKSNPERGQAAADKFTAEKQQGSMGKHNAEVGPSSYEPGRFAALAVTIGDMILQQTEEGPEPQTAIA